MARPPTTPTNNHMDKNQSPSTRIYVLLAREAPIGVVFRRGPSRQVQLLKWEIDSDIIIPGQWFNGRIYERRCDLSPSGKKLIYFAANYKAPYGTWTAISKPPYLTAIASWPKGDGWGGGGLFKKEKEILLNHRPEEMSLSEDSNLPHCIKIHPYGERPGWGEDDPVLSDRLSRDGWQLITRGKRIKNRFGSQIWIENNPPEEWHKKSPSADSSLNVQMQIRGIHERNGPWYVIEYNVYNNLTQEHYPLGRADWADWCQSGDLLYSKDGKIFRLKFSNIQSSKLQGNETIIADLSGNKFTRVKPPESATIWGGI